MHRKSEVITPRFFLRYVDKCQHCGMLIKGMKRHPTIGNNVTIYSGASVLGDITIGDNSVIGGNVWLTESLPAGTKITARPPENTFKFAKERNL